ncbi:MULTISPECIES: hypothetical protein [Sorangium]|uniref:Uncharacterized protein n=1 Tax=Sorangium cellulosum TaxID=56 RepID=A0A4P2R4S3_SORCE|nr:MULTISPECIES: hypothetical protein [Sorangium]AUX38090.1 uncharacterized protein SOCE836_103300 [Sorangium cellulosum]WCQ97378.1 hypothetical protein NQZ70_10172 [Sorangium sp. Soce836]
MQRSKLVGIAMVALAAVSCGDDGGDHPPVPVDVEELLARAGHSRNDHRLASSLRQRGLLCKDGLWLPEVYWPPLGPPRIERIVLVAWDMPAGTLRGWELVQNASDRRYWSVALSAEEVGFGCEERYTTSFFLLASWPDNNVSRAIGLERAAQLALQEDISSDDAVLVNHYTLIDVERASVPVPDTATYYLQNLFTGATFSIDVPTEGDGSPDYVTQLEVDYGELGLGAMTDVATGVVYKREGVELTNHCLTVTDTTLP